MLKPVSSPPENSFIAPAKSLNEIDEGVLRLGRSSQLPKALAEASESDENSVRPGSLVISITLAALIFIGIITWFIAQMPVR